ncbi:MAG TPA: RNA methyltransferase [Spirochaetales bacterium]|nr:RNA methyltransferase [Spirochaetales bacterium]HPM72116.1 RNA methyltransferase [Spirochaetales bacterium]
MRGEPAFDRLAVVLCRVEGSMNVGAACRAMKAMGVRRLVLAACPDHDQTEVRTHALGAYDLYEAAERFDDLGEALAGFSLAAGLTRRVGQRRKESAALPDFAARLAARLVAAEGRAGQASSAAIVFGNERDGLSDAELSLCDEAVRIDTSDLFPSLNLSHAVQIACWELREAVLATSSREGPGTDRPGRTAAPRSSAARAAARMADAMQAAGLYKLAGRPDAEAFLREVAARAALSETELERLSSLFIRLGALGSLDRGPGR